jgi:hypothetical protein
LLLKLAKSNSKSSGKGKKISEQAAANQPAKGIAIHLFKSEKEVVFKQK